MHIQQLHFLMLFLIDDLHNKVYHYDRASFRSHVASLDFSPRNTSLRELKCKNRTFFVYCFYSFHSQKKGIYQNRLITCLIKNWWRTINHPKFVKHIFYFDFSFLAPATRRTTTKMKILSLTLLEEEKTYQQTMLEKSKNDSRGFNLFI